jgi:hypothetical protein
MAPNEPYGLGAADVLFKGEQLIPRKSLFPLINARSIFLFVCFVCPCPLKKEDGVKRISLSIMALFIIFHSSLAITVSGTVKDYITQATVESCMVQLIGVSPNTKTDSMLSNAAGAFAFANVPAGIYRIRTTGSRYADDSVNALISGDTSFVLDLFALSHILVGGAVPDTLTKAGSPYLVTSYLYAAKPLIIMPGVKMVFMPGTALRTTSDITAIGTAADSIIFEARRDTMFAGRLYLASQNGTFRFSYCRFERLLEVWTDCTGVGGSCTGLFADFEHCLFDGMLRVINPSTRSKKIRFAQCRIQNSIGGIGDFTRARLADTVELVDNYIQSKEYTIFLEPLSPGEFYMRRNTLMGPSYIDCITLSGRDTIASNIFTNNAFQNQSYKILFFAYNDHTFSASGDYPQGVGANILKNAKGDSCDAYYNIIRDPLFSDSATGVLKAGSPCIGTGMGGENMGVYQGPGVSTGVLKQTKARSGEKQVFSILSCTPGIAIRLLFERPSNQAVSAGSISLYSLSGTILTKILLGENQNSVKLDLSDIRSGMVIVKAKIGTWEHAGWISVVK